MTPVREVGWFFMHDLNLGSLKYYLGNLEEGVRDFSSLSTKVSPFIALVGRMSYIHVMCFGVL